MTEGNYNSVLQGLYEEKSSLLYNIERSQNQILIWDTRLNKVNEAIEDLIRKKDDYIGNRESDY